MRSQDEEFDSVPAPFTVDENAIKKLIKKFGIKFARATVRGTRELYGLDEAEEIQVKPDAEQDYKPYCAGFAGKSPDSFKDLTTRQALAYALGHASLLSATLLSRKEVTEQLDKLLGAPTCPPSTSSSPP